MKYHGSKFEYERERNEDLMRAYHKLTEESKHLSMAQLCKEVVNMPSSRFWVSEERAKVVIYALMGGDNLSYMRKNKRDMFMEIYRRAMELKQKYPHLSIPLIASMVVYQPAPKFYLTPGSARVYIFGAKKKWYEQRKRRVLHLP